MQISAGEHKPVDSKRNYPQHNTPKQHSSQKARRLICVLLLLLLLAVGSIDHHRLALIYIPGRDSACFLFAGRHPTTFNLQPKKNDPV